MIFFFKLEILPLTEINLCWSTKITKTTKFKILKLNKNRNKKYKI